MEAPNPPGADAAANSQQSPPRRRFFVVLGKSAAGVASVGVILAAIGFVYPPSRRWLRWPRFAAEFQAVAALESLPPGEWKLFSLTPDSSEDPPKQRSIWVRRESGKETLVVLSAVCPHFGCIVAWRENRKLFVCPCHGGTFDADGNRKSGPPQRALARVDYRIKDGQLLVRADDV